MSESFVLHFLRRPGGRFGKAETSGNRLGDELIYDARGFRIFVAASVGVESIGCWGAGQLDDRARASTGRTDKGFRMRATPDEVLKTYGLRRS